MEPFKPGDLVCLKSGGPSMTVEEIAEREVICSWFNTVDEFQRKHISKFVLMHLPRTEKAAPVAAKNSRPGFQDRGSGSRS